MGLCHGRKERGRKLLFEGAVQRNPIVRAREKRIPFLPVRNAPKNAETESRRREHSASPPWTVAGGRYILPPPASPIANETVVGSLGNRVAQLEYAKCRSSSPLAFGRFPEQFRWPSAQTGDRNFEGRIRGVVVFKFDDCLPRIWGPAEEIRCSLTSDRGSTTKRFDEAIPPVSTRRAWLD